MHLTSDRTPDSIRKHSHIQVIKTILEVVGGVYAVPKDYSKDYILYPQGVKFLSSGIHHTRNFYCFIHDQRRGKNLKAQTAVVKLGAENALFLL